MSHFLKRLQATAPCTLVINTHHFHSPLKISLSPSNSLLHATYIICNFIFIEHLLLLLDLSLSDRPLFRLLHGIKYVIHVYKHVTVTSLNTCSLINKLAFQSQLDVDIAVSKIKRMGLLKAFGSAVASSKSFYGSRKSSASSFSRSQPKRATAL